MDHGNGAPLFECMFNAASTSSAVMRSPMAQPTAHRLHASTTTARKMKLAQMGTSVMSAIHGTFGVLGNEATPHQIGCLLLGAIALRGDAVIGTRLPS
jgi:hypothetical protein